MTPVTRRRGAVAVVLVSAVLVGSRLLGVADLAVPSAAPPVLRVLSAPVEVRIGDGAFAAAGDGQILAEGMTVRTGVAGRAAIEFADGSITRLDAETVFYLSEVTPPDSDSGSGSVTGFQDSGGSFHRVTELTDSRARFEVVTPTATASVQGTAFAVVLNPDGSTTVAVFAGTVLAGAPGGAGVPVLAGFMVTIGSDGSVAGPERIPDDLLRSDWVVFNCEIEGGFRGIAEVCLEGSGSTTTTGGSGSTTTVPVPTTVTSTTSTLPTTSVPSTTSTTAAAVAGIVLTGSSAQMDPVCQRTYRATLVDSAGKVVDDDRTVVTFGVSGGGSLVFTQGATVTARNGVATVVVTGGDLGVVRLQATAGGLGSNVIEFNVVPPGGCSA